MRYYTKTDEWVLVEGDKAKIGISIKAADLLGDVVFLDFPNLDDTFKQGETFGAIESVKAASDLYMPIGGTVISVNDKLVDFPELINEDALIEFIIEIKDFDI